MIPSSDSFENSSNGCQPLKEVHAGTESINFLRNREALDKAQPRVGSGSCRDANTAFKSMEPVFCPPKLSVPTCAGSSGKGCRARVGKEDFSCRRSLARSFQPSDGHIRDVANEPDDAAGKNNYEGVRGWKPGGHCRVGYPDRGLKDVYRTHNSGHNGRSDSTSTSWRIGVGDGSYVIVGKDFYSTRSFWTFRSCGDLAVSTNKDTFNGVNTSDEDSTSWLASLSNDIAT